MLKKLLFKYQDRKQLIIAMIGSLLGMTFLITSIHYLVKINEFGSGQDVLGPNTVIIQKKVSNSSLIGLSNSSFSPADLRVLRSQAYVLRAEPVENNNFDVSLATNQEGIPYFRTDVFVQTIDKEFIDVKTNEWHWSPKDKVVPMILPRDFLVMMNLFMGSKGIPQISENFAKKIKFRFRLRPVDKSYEEWIDVKIIGFTNEISSLLVPKEFMDFANKKYAPEVKSAYKQVIVSAEESKFGSLEQYLTKRNYEIKKSQLAIGKLKSIAATLILIVMSISIIAVLLSGLVLIQYLQLLLSRNLYEIRTLLRIGQHPKDIVKTLAIYFGKVFGMVCLIALLLFLIVKYSVLDQLLIDGGIGISSSPSILAIASLILAFVLFYACARWSATKGVVEANKG